VPITLSDGLSGERHKLTNTQIRTSGKKQPGFATQSPNCRHPAATQKMAFCADSVEKVCSCEG
jgi:hypothetical protein